MRLILWCSARVLCEFGRHCFIDLSHQVNVIHLSCLQITKNVVADHLFLQVFDAMLVLDLDGFALGLFFSDGLNGARMISEQPLCVDVVFELFEHSRHLSGRLAGFDQLRQVTRDT